MNEKKKLLEWKITDKLPETFVKWLKELIAEKEIHQKISFAQIANEIHVRPSILSRWLGGMGPLDQNDIDAMAAYLGSSVYITLRLIRPNNPSG